jgi:TetR/AcrR family transcriptional regulator
LTLDQETNHASGAAEEELGERALRTRNAILDAARHLFLERGYSGTRINNITDACGISRAGFYTYFKDKHEVAELLGETAYQDILDVIGKWDAMPTPATLIDVTAWVQDYFAFMDLHGAFVFAASQSAPDEEFRKAALRMQMRVAFLLGMSLRNRATEPTDAPEALGLTTLAMLDRSWHFLNAQNLPVSQTDVINAAATTILHNLTGRTA